MEEGTRKEEEDGNTEVRTWVKRQVRSEGGGKGSEKVVIRKEGDRGVFRRALGEELEKKRLKGSVKSSSDWRLSRE